MRKKFISQAQNTDGHEDKRYRSEMGLYKLKTTVGSHNIVREEHP
jgi:hypothetical protein